MTLNQFINELHREESGQDLLEYGLVLAAVLTAVVAGSQALATTIGTGISTLTSRIQSAVG